MGSSRARSASPTRGVIRRRKARAPQRYFGCSTRVAWLATWCATRLSPDGHRLATTASLGAARRPENGRSKAKSGRLALPLFSEGDGSGVARSDQGASRSGRKLLRKNQETRRSPVEEQSTRTGSPRAVLCGPIRFSGTDDGPYMACLKGKSFPLGATLVPGGANFSVFAKHSTGAQLLLFDNEDAPMPSGVIDLDPRANRTYHYWRVFVPGVTTVRSMDTGSPGLSTPSGGCVSTATRYCSILTGNALPGRKDAAARPHGVRGTMPLRP